MIQAKEKDVEKRSLYMMDSMPTYYDESPEANAIMRGNATEAERKRAEAGDLLNQLFVSTATWGLDYWDRVLALNPAPRMELNGRRERILSKLNGSAPATIENLTKILNIYAQNNNAYIEDYPSEYRFEGFIPISGDFDLKVDDVYKAINEIKPAHLAFILGIVARSTIEIWTKQYTFDVPYKITNCFHTAPIKGGMMSEIVHLTEKAYGFEVLYPITNTFVTAATAFENEEINVVLAAEYRSNEIEYKRAGMIYAGEGDI